MAAIFSVSTLIGRRFYNSADVAKIKAVAEAGEITVLQAAAVFDHVQRPGALLAKELGIAEDKAARLVDGVRVLHAQGWKAAPPAPKKPAPPRRR